MEIITRLNIKCTECAVNKEIVNCYYTSENRDEKKDIAESFAYYGKFDKQVVACLSGGHKLEMSYSKTTTE